MEEGGRKCDDVSLPLLYFPNGEKEREDVEVVAERGEAGRGDGGRGKAMGRDMMLMFVFEIGTSPL